MSCFSHNKGITASLSFAIILFLSGCLPSWEITIPSALKEDSKRWEPVFKPKIWGLNKAKIGPFTTTYFKVLDTGYNTSASKTPLIHILSVDQTIRTQKYYKLVMTDGRDTASLVTFDSTEVFVRVRGMFSNAPDRIVPTGGFAHGNITVTGNTGSWNFYIENYYELWKGDTTSKTINGLINNNNGDTLSFKELIEYTNKKFAPSPNMIKGIALLDNTGNAMAAIQLETKNYIWIRQSIPSNRQLMIAAFFSLLLHLEGKD